MTRLALAWIGCWLALLATGMTQEPAANDNASAPTAEQTARLQDRDELAARAQTLQAEGKLAEAIDVAQQVLAIEREVFGDVHEEIAGTYGWIGDMQEVAEDFMAAEKSRQAALDLLTRILGADDWRVTDARIAVDSVRQLADLDEPDRTELSRVAVLNRRTNELWLARKFREALPIVEEALVINKKVLGAEHPDYADSLNNLAMLYDSMAEYARAEPLYRQALEIKKKVLGEDHPHYAMTLNNLAGLYRSMAEYVRAEPLYRQALEIRKKVLGEEHPDYAESLNNLALLYDSMADYALAEPLYRQALEINKKVLGEEHPHYAIGLNNLAALYDSMADYARAEPLYRQALEIKKKVLGEEHPDYATSLHNLAVLYRSMADYALAEPLYRQALEIKKRVLGEEHPDYAVTLNNLAGLYVSMAEYVRAEPLYRQALEIQGKVLGEEHTDYARSLNNLALLYDSMGDYARAEALYRQALEIKRKVLGEEHPDYAMTLNNLAELYRSMADYARAEPLFRQALEIRKDIFGEEHPDFAASLHNLAALYVSTAEHARAEPLYRQALEIKKRVLGEEHPDYAVTLNNLAGLYRSTAEYARAEPLYRQALEINKKVLGEQHPDYARSLANLSVVYESTGDHSSSRALLRDAAGAYEAARLRLAERSLDRAAFGVERSPYRYLAAVEAGHGDAIEAGRALEGDLARGQLDEATSRAGLQLTAAEEQERVDLNATLAGLQPRILRLVLQTNADDAAQAELADLLEQRSAASARLARLAAAFSQRQVADLKNVQVTLPADGAFVTWVDVASANGDIQEHWGCVVRADRPPTWVRLPGTGPEGAWTEDDTALPKRLREALAQAAAPEEIAELSRQLAAQRMEPLLLHLDGVERLYVAAVNDMAGVPIDVLTDRFTISYTPSGTQLVRLRERERATREATLLALGDPVFAQPGDDADAPTESPRLPPGGLLVTHVIPQGNADNSQIAAGDVLLAYAGVDLTGIQQLGELVAAHAMDESVAVTIWRESEAQPLDRKLAPGKLGVALAREPAPEAIARRRESDLLLASVTRGKLWDALPGTKAEIAALAELLPEHVTLLADSDASEQQLAALRDSGELEQYRYLHLATHGHVNEASAFESALILAQDDLSTVDDVAAGAEFFDGRLTANEILEHWKLNAELVTLSSCESGLGREGGGEGFLGFAQALLLAGSRSVCLSLWEVDDTATALLMDRFYRNLLGKRDGLDAPFPKAEALAEAKRWLRSLTVSQAADLAADLSHGVARGAGHATQIVDLVPPSADDADSHPYDHPYYWAAFVLIGDPE